MGKQTTVLEKQREFIPEAQFAVTTAPASEPLLREALGATLRECRRTATMTLRDLAERANVSPGYLSELERGRKEVSSELLAAVCHALGVSVSAVIMEAAGMMALDAAAAELAASMANAHGEA